MSNPLSREARDAMRARVNLQKAANGAAWEGAGLTMPLVEAVALLDALDAAEAERDKARAAERQEYEFHIDTMNEIVEHAGDEWDGDEAIDAIAVRYVRHLERAEALVSSLGSALHTVWLVTEDCTQYREEDEQLHAISETARAALQGWEKDPANPNGEERQ